MNATNSFFVWYFVEGLGGIGGWILFLILGMAAFLWVTVDRSNRHLSALPWQLGAGLPLLLVLPSAVTRFSSLETIASLTQSLETFFYLGVLGGLLPIVVAIGYAVYYRGMLECEKHHLYEASLGACPVCNGNQTANIPVVQVNAMSYQDSEDPTEFPHKAAPQRPLARAFLVNSLDSGRYNLFSGDTRIGRKASVNDVTISHPTVGREHILIREQNGHYTLYDRGSSSGTFVNGKRLRGSILLENGDQITLGEVSLKFMLP